MEVCFMTSSASNKRPKKKKEKDKVSIICLFWSFKFLIDVFVFKFVLGTRIIQNFHIPLCVYVPLRVIVNHA
jgi:hypothetical protein